MGNKAKHLTIRVSESLASRIDKLSKESGMSKSELLRGMILSGYSHYIDTFSSMPEGMELDEAIQWRSAKPRVWNK